MAVPHLQPLSLNMEVRICLLTGVPLDQPATTSTDGGTYFEYSNPLVGKVKIGFLTVIDFQSRNDFKHPILAGICRNAFERGQQPPLITQDFIANDLKNIDYPKELREKARYLLKYVYDKGGKDFKEMMFQTDKDYPICYATDEEEFVRIMKYLIEVKYWVKCARYTGSEEGGGFYFGTTLNESGIHEVERELPRLPMSGLIQQTISTGNASSDSQINTAIRLFTNEPPNLEYMRSACQTLAYVLEPLRNELSSTGYFTSKDVNDFFQIVNNFDIRHNKDTTKNIQHPEQLEWVFYSLLNTINTYVKLKARLG